jgi:hypothetical protein
MQQATSPQKPNSLWAGVAFGVFIGVAISTLYLIAYILWATIDAAGTPEAVNTGALWIFGAIACAGVMIPAGITGGLMGAVMGAFYQSRPRRLSAIGALIVGGIVAVMVLLFSYLSLRGLVGEAEWDTFFQAYGGGADTGFLVGLYALLVFGGMIALSFQLNRRLQQ